MTQSTSSTKLVDAMYDVFKTSKTWFTLSLALAFTIYVLGVLSAIIVSPKLVNLLAVGAVVVQMGSFLARLQSEKYYGFGEKIRRLNLLHDGLGAEVSPLEIAKIFESAGKTKFLKGPASDRYFDSVSPKGPRRLIEHLGECAFWTSALAKRVMRIFFALSAFGFLTGIFGLMVLILGEGQDAHLSSFAKAVVPGLAFWSAGDVTSTALKYLALTRDAGAVSEKADVLLSDSSKISERAAQNLMNEYNCALAASLPIPDAIHRRNQDLLNELWSKKDTVTT